MESRIPSSRKVLASILGAILLITGAAGVWYGYFKSPDATPPAHSVNDPRLTFETPFRNVKPDIRYVGDSTCIGCHVAIAQSYHAHPMGRSASHVRPREGPEKFTPQAHNPFSANGYEFTIESKADAERHIMQRAGGSEKQSAEILVAIGSGTRGRSYLHKEEAGAVYQSPVSWFGQRENRWDLSPGYLLPDGARRPVIAECLYCHVNQAIPVRGSLNRYQEPVFNEQMNIGCERCHGPGELHCAERRAQAPTELIDTSIVNPKHLSPELRAGICQQCHLQGEVRVDRRGTSATDYRPGLPFEQFVTVFVRHPAWVEPSHSVSQFEQMTVSKCFTQSNGQLGCTSCHDPHTKASEAERSSFYRTRCLNCHEVENCRSAPAERAARNDYCTECHMPKAASSNIVHTAVTDHRITRLGKLLPRSAPGRLPLNTDPIVSFVHSPHSPPREELNRDLGLALAQMAGRFPPDDVRTRNFVSLRGQDLLIDSTIRWPGDAESWHGLAYTRYFNRDLFGALEAQQKSCEQEPDSESRLTALTEFQLANQDHQGALQSATRLTQMNPSLLDHTFRLALAHLGLKDWTAAESACRMALRKQPLHARLRMVVAVCRFHQNDREGATHEFDNAMALITSPEQKREYLNWFKLRTRPIFSRN